MDVRLPDGTVIKGVPDGMSKADFTAKLKANGYDTSGLEQKAETKPYGWGDFAKNPLSIFDGAHMPTEEDAQAHPARTPIVGSMLSGAAKAMGSVGATLTGADNQKRQQIDAGVNSLNEGANVSKPIETVGKIGTEAYLGTKIAGPALAKVAEFAQAPASLVNALRTSGMTTGAPVAPGFANVAKDLALRSAASGATGAGMVGMFDPEEAKKAALIGLLTPGVLKAAGATGQYLGDALNSKAKEWMQSALKPSVKAQANGDAETAVNTLLSEGLNVTKGGVAKLKDRISGVNDEISGLISNSPAEVKKQAVIDALNGTRDKFMKQVSPASDLSAIDAVEQGFAAHPLASGDSMPVQLAQQLKQGTYRVLNGKYGQQGSAETEAQKALARGLKEQVAEAVPAVAGLNARESALLSTLKLTERRALMEANKNPMGLAALASNPASWAAFMADRSAAFKSVAARLANGASKAAYSTQNAIPDFVQKTGLIPAANAP